ncbi:hypothetical protein [Nonomuraea mesophila]|uniref:hypothetical protein n=1 Tax=Nonomuraea mesophila TaxID=2530382 RepID=UPI0014077397|nr:hypothetical protein [Nonomuraea mesophila]
MILRLIAESVLSLYPSAWRQRYGEEVADLVASRPVRVRTVLDLIGGAADAWLHHRRIPGRRPFHVPATAVLCAMGITLALLWNPGVRDLRNLHRVWAEAAGAAETAGATGTLTHTLQGMATSLFVTAGLMATLVVVMIALAASSAMGSLGQGLVTRVTARRVVWTAAFVAVPIALLGYVSFAQAFAGAVFPVGPLGDAMAGGFFVPSILALSLPVFMAAAEVPSLASEVRTGARVLAVAAIVTALAWLPVATLMLLGMAQASWPFVTAVTASALVSVCMAALAARLALRQGRTARVRLTAA